ncbi:hypothetical protein [Streptomyces sp. NBC_01431]|uniref:hypothetical protein n=1 Tax=Streptomyces sp. NBC_01431 TaxID=2903863 RepID=UPI002E329631|nr:hypothetical protein [Streptomyces sp. NBC_01431]
MSAQETSRVLVALATRLAAADEGQSGALWRLTQESRQLDANLVRLPADASVPGHVEAELDVLLVVVDGAGHLDDGVSLQELEPGVVAWLPKAAPRGLRAGPRGLAYLTVHRRRPGLTIGGRTAAAEEGGEAACALDRVCPACGRMRAEARAPFCSWCGEEVGAA